MKDAGDGEAGSDAAATNFNGDSDGKRSDVPEEQPAKSVLPTAVPEAQVSDEMTWQELPDEKLPTRLLTSFVFCRHGNLAVATLEELLIFDGLEASEKPDIFGFGVIIPPPDVELEPVLVELQQVVEWQIE